VARHTACLLLTGRHQAVHDRRESSVVSCFASLLHAGRQQAVDDDTEISVAGLYHGTMRVSYRLNTHACVMIGRH
jgi:hypothetical protein